MISEGNPRFNLKQEYRALMNEALEHSPTTDSDLFLQRARRVDSVLTSKMMDSWGWAGLTAKYLVILGPLAGAFTAAHLYSFAISFGGGFLADLAFTEYAYHRGDIREEQRGELRKAVRNISSTDTGYSYFPY